jgi:methyl-accepting chemotaxis protein
VSFEQMTLAISTLERRFGDAAAGTQTYVNAFAQLGLSVEDLAGKTSAERFETVADAISRMATPAQQLAVSGKLFEEAGVKLVPLFQNGAKGLKAMVAEARSLGITLEGVDYNSFERIGDAFGRVQAQLTSIAARVAEKVAPTIERVAQVINEALDPDTADRFASTVATYFEQAGDFLIDAADATIETLRPFYEYVTGANTAAAENLSSFFTNVQNAMRGVYGAFSTIGGLLLNILSIPAHLARLLVSAMEGVFDAINVGGILGDNPFEGFREAAGELTDGLDSVVVSMREAGREQYSVLLGMSDNVGENVARPVREAFDKFSKSTPKVDVRGLEEDRESRKKLQDAALRQQSQLAKTIERATSPAAFLDYNTSGGRSEFHRMERGGEWAKLAGEQLTELKKIAENTVGSNLPEPVVSLG